MAKAKQNRKWLIGPVLVILLIAGGVLAYQKLKPSTPNTCPVLEPPVDVSKVTAVLYPGQFRGGQYKPHGGFRLDSQKTNEVQVLAPLDATLVDASQYLEQGETQYILDFKTSCGLDYRFDHLKKLTAKIQAVVQKLPPPQNEQSETHSVQPIKVSVGEVVAIEVGLENGPSGRPNVSFDFGV